MDSLRRSEGVSNTTPTARHRAGTSHFSLLTSHFSLPRVALLLLSTFYALLSRAAAFTRGLPPGGSCDFSLLRGVPLLLSTLDSLAQRPLPAGCRQAAHRVFPHPTSHPRALAQWHWLSDVSHAWEDSLCVETPRPDHATRAVDVNRPVRHWSASAAPLSARLRAVTGGLTSPARRSHFFAAIERKPMPLGSRPAAHATSHFCAASLFSSLLSTPSRSVLYPQAAARRLIACSHTRLLTSHFPHRANSLARVHGAALPRRRQHTRTVTGN
ncbi:MAG: hypothetical protein RLZZ436_3380 [Planctomycetota bacterium]